MSSGTVLMRVISIYYFTSHNRLNHPAFNHTTFLHRAVPLRFMQCCDDLLFVKFIFVFYMNKKMYMNYAHTIEETTFVIKSFNPIASTIYDSSCQQNEVCTCTYNL